MKQQPTIDDDDGSEGYAGDTTLCPGDYDTAGLMTKSSDQLGALSRPSSRCSNLSTSSLHLSQMELSDDSEDESVQNPKVTHSG